MSTHFKQAHAVGITCCITLKGNGLVNILYFYAPAGWTKLNPLYFLDSIEITSIGGLTLWCPEINDSKSLWYSYLFSLKSESQCDVSVTRIGDILSSGFPQSD